MWPERGQGREGGSVVPIAGHWCRGAAGKDATMKTRREGRPGERHPDPFQAIGGQGTPGVWRKRGRPEWSLRPTRTSEALSPRPWWSRGAGFSSGDELGSAGAPLQRAGGIGSAERWGRYGPRIGDTGGPGAARAPCRTGTPRAPPGSKILHTADRRVAPASADTEG